MEAKHQRNTTFFIRFFWISEAFMLSLHPRRHRFRNENVYIGVYQHPYRLAGSVLFYTPENRFGRWSLVDRRQFKVIEIQQSTFQVPCGEHSLIEALKTRVVWMSAFALYMVLVYRSNWQTGLSHALSYTELAKLLGMKVSRVKQAMKWLVDNGWVIKNHRGPNKANTYQLIHHICEPHQVPDDPDRLPKMCAMPRAEGSPMELMFAGEITWKQMVIWYIKKYISDWTTGEVEATYAKILEYVRFSCSTICEALKTFKKLGLLKRISKAFCSGEYQLFPKPYEKR
ncbi:hypothetical protein C6503_03675 [Candidatus Poribacteria bacterium]|nr:MAG: hypothetical protein C6503_03675 [Candidatus Poribacteria bacterium]